MKRIGILGGSFDPIHLGHLILAQTALEKVNLDEIIFIPTAQAPHKRSLKVTEAKHRLAMIKSAIKSNPQFSVSDYEIKKGGVSYTIDTVNHLLEKEKAKYFFILGGDMVDSLPSWKYFDQLSLKVTFIAMKRPGSRQKGAFKLKLLDMPEVGISSTDIRRRVKLGKIIEYLAPTPVVRYIQKHNLYTS